MFLHFEMGHTGNILLFINLKVVNHLFILLTESLTENKVYTHTNIYISFGDGVDLSVTI